MSNSTSRRTLLKAGLGAGALLAGNASFSAAHAEEIRMRMFWWGGQERNRRTLEVGAKYHDRHPDITMIGEQSSADYWQKLVTMMAGRNIPDVFQLEPNTLADFSKRGA